MKIAAISLSALSLHRQRIETAADNLANMNSFGTDDTVFQPKRTSAIALNSGGVMAKTQLISPGALPVFSPDHPDADANGQVMAPNISPAAELVEIKSAEAGYKASLRLLQVADDMTDHLLDISDKRDTR